MRYLIIPLLLLLCTTVYGQRQGVQVTYLQQVNPNHDAPDASFFSEDNYARLLTNGSISTYRYGQGGSGKEVDADEHNNFKITYSDPHGYVYHRDRLKGRLVSRELIHDQPFLIEEDIPRFAWSVTDSTRQIGSYTCKLATTVFRGRSYEAWFAPELPFDAGPWKLGGLPGLILEAYDREKIIQFKFVSLQGVKVDNEALNETPKGGIRVSFDQFFATRARKQQQLIDKIASMPGVTVTVDSDPAYMETTR